MHATSLGLTLKPHAAAFRTQGKSDFSRRLEDEVEAKEREIEKLSRRCQELTTAASDARRLRDEVRIVWV